MARMRSFRKAVTAIFIFLISLSVLLAFAPLPSLSRSSSQSHLNKGSERRFEIAEDMFWKDGEPFRIIGGDLHYFRVLPEYWEDRLLRAKALGLNTIQTYVPWNLHEPRQGQLVFEGIADLVSFLRLCQKMDMLVMLRAGPYICGEWDFGGFPAWLLAKEPAVRIRSSDPDFLVLVDRWWQILLPKVSPLLYHNGGPIIMVQVENEFGSYGDDQAYLHYLVKLARRHLGDDIILYTTDGGSRDTLEKGTITGDNIFSAVDFTTGDDPWPIFKLQKEFNAPGKSLPLSTEYYTGWLTHWGENIATTDATRTAVFLEKILSKNGSAVLYMAHGGTNFGFYSGANTGENESDYKPDLTSYDYNAPISESGGVDNAKYRALRRVIAKYSAASLPSVPSDNKKTAYGGIKLEKTSFLFDSIDTKNLLDVVESENPTSMEAVGQMFGFVLYVSEYTAKGNGSMLFIPKVHDRGQVFISCPEDNGKRPRYVDLIMRWSNKPISLPHRKCRSKNRLYILVENMGRLNYGPYMSDRKGILSPVFLDGRPLYKWKMLPITLHNLNERQQFNTIIMNAQNEFLNASSHRRLKNHKLLDPEPAFYIGHFQIDEVADTYISFKGWSKGIVFVNGFNVGRFWPSRDHNVTYMFRLQSFKEEKMFWYENPELLRHMQVVLELELPSPDLLVTSVDHPDFTCKVGGNKVHNF